MKLKINSLIKGVAAVFCGAVLFACTDLNELEDRVDSLDSRITALETQVPSMNSTLEAIDKLLEGQNIFITSFEPVEGKEGEYTLTLSDDTSKEYKIVTGVSGSAPQITLEEGVWKVNGEEVGQAAPQFRIDADGNWEVSSDGGKTFDDVKDADGNPVSAVSDGSNEFFKGVSYDEESGIVTFIMADGAEYSFTVSSDFILTITDAEGNALEGIQTFIPGEAKTFNVQLRGVEDIYITKPSGWDVSLTGDEGTGDVTATLTVTPPTREELIGAQTKISADTEKDIVLHATAAASDRAIFAKIQVEAVLTAMPEVTVAAGEFTPTSISFTVNPNADATSWKYILKPASESVPTVDEVNTNGTESTSEEITITSGLTTGTEYAIYVLAINTKEETVTTATKLATAKNTPMYDTYSAMYDANMTITIAGIEINKTTYGNAVLIDGNSHTNIDNITTGEKEGVAVYFVNTDTEITIVTNQNDNTKNIGTLIIIGNNPDKKAKVTLKTQICINRNTTYSDTQSLICHNIVLDASGASTYPIRQNLATKYDNVIFDECDLKIPVANNLIYLGNEGKDIGKLSITNCTMDITGRNNKQIIHAGSVAVNIDEFDLSNNIIYSTGESVNDTRIITMTGGTIKKLDIKNNSFINAAAAISGGSQAMFDLGTCNDITCTKNIILIGYQSSAAKSATFFKYSTSVSGVCHDNILYKANAGDPFATLRNSGGTAENPTDIFGEGSENFTLIENNPFDGGTFNVSDVMFIPNSTYSSYGSTIGR